MSESGATESVQQTASPANGTPQRADSKTSAVVRIAPRPAAATDKTADGDCPAPAAATATAAAAARLVFKRNADGTKTRIVFKSSSAVAAAAAATDAHSASPSANGLQAARASLSGEKTPPTTTTAATTAPPCTFKVTRSPRSGKLTINATQSTAPTGGGWMGNSGASSTAAARSIVLPVIKSPRLAVSAVGQLIRPPTTTTTAGSSSDPPPVGSTRIADADRSPVVVRSTSSAENRSPPDDPPNQRRQQPPVKSSPKKRGPPAVGAGATATARTPVNKVAPARRGRPKRAINAPKRYVTELDAAVTPPPTTTSASAKKSSDPTGSHNHNQQPKSEESTSRSSSRCSGAGGSGNRPATVTTTAVGLAHASTFNADAGCALLAAENRYNEAGCCRQTCVDRILDADLHLPAAAELAGWSTAQVRGFIGRLPFMTQTDADGFAREQVDGQALLLCTAADIGSRLNVRLGPCVKLINLLRAIKHRQ